MRKKSVADALLRGERKKKWNMPDEGSYLTRGGVGETYKTKLRFQPLYFARDFISILMDPFMRKHFSRRSGKIVLKWQDIL